jgi:hypothetical protein
MAREQASGTRPSNEEDADQDAAPASGEPLPDDARGDEPDLPTPENPPSVDDSFEI